jgi:hypothetical protein
MTNAESLQASTQLRNENYVQDDIALSEYLIEKHGHEKIFVLGHYPSEPWPPSEDLSSTMPISQLPRM